MLTLRLHLDDTGRDNGALDIVPRSHSFGRVPAAEVSRMTAQTPAVACVAKAGDILAMRLTTIHKSDRAANPNRRRVSHVDYSPDDLPSPLEWRMSRVN